MKLSFGSKSLNTDFFKAKFLLFPTLSVRFMFYSPAVIKLTTCVHCNTGQCWRNTDMINFEFYQKSTVKNGERCLQFHQKEKQNAITATNKKDSLGGKSREDQYKE